MFCEYGETCCSGQFRDHGLSTTNNPLLTNDRVRRDLLRECKRQFANLPDDLRLIRLCSDACFMKTPRTIIRDFGRSGTGKIGGFMKRVHITSR